MDINTNFENENENETTIEKPNNIFLEVNMMELDKESFVTKYFIKDALFEEYIKNVSSFENRMNQKGCFIILFIYKTLMSFSQSYNNITVTSEIYPTKKQFVNLYNILSCVSNTEFLSEKLCDILVNSFSYEQLIAVKYKYYKVNLILEEQQISNIYYDCLDKSILEQTDFKQHIENYDSIKNELFKLIEKTDINKYMLNNFLVNISKIIKFDDDKKIAYIKLEKVIFILGNPYMKLEEKIELLFISLKNY